MTQVLLRLRIAMVEVSPVPVAFHSLNNANMSSSAVIHQILDILVPSGGEIQVSVAAAVLVVLFYCFLQHLNHGGAALNRSVSGVDLPVPTPTAMVTSPLNGVRIYFVFDSVYCRFTGL